MDRRTAYTRMVIRDSLYKLLEKKHLSEITVKELCELADINRATFYRNYQDIYDLFEKLEEQLTEEAFQDNDIEKDRYRLLEIIYQNQPFYREFFDSHLESQYIRKTVEKMYEEMKETLIRRGTYDEKTFTVSYQYNYYGAIGVIREWLDRGCSEKPRELGDILYSIVEKQYQ
ncbi:MAG: TetR/AcrR family transcriptional regulator [Anaerovoracaceae bacterium]|jgi:AcrR family transcriptional regulator